MKWEKVKLSDVTFKIQTGPFGSQLHQSDYKSNGIPVIMPKDIKERGISEESIAKVDELKAKELMRHRLCINDIIYPRRGDIAKCAIIQTRQEGWLCGTGCLKVCIDQSKADPAFVFYQLNTYEKTSWLEKHAIGATMLNLNAGILGNVPLELPPLHIQQRIASILSRYDDLIENYQQQVKLLEEAAQRLYKEWFVNLHFPGYETTKIVDGVPEGWKRKKISDVCQTVGGGTPSTKIESYYKNGNIKWVTPTDVTRSKCLCLLDTDKKITEEGLKHSPAKMLPSETILMTSRASVGYLGLFDCPVCTNQGFISCIPYSENFQMYLLYNLRERVGEIRQKAGGATYLEISKSVFRELVIIEPCKIILDKFQRIVHEWIDQMRNLSSQINHLTEARDRLLPKLMSEEIEV